MTYVVFVHIPRTGGTRIRYALDQWDVIQHRTVEQFVEKYGEKWASMESFSVVRNPFSRAVSMYRFLHGENSDLSFAEWVKAGMPDRMGCDPVLYRGRKFEFDVRTPQVDILSFGGRVGVKNILRFEDMPDGFFEVTGRSIAWSQESDADDWAKLYDDTSMRIIADLYASDFEVFQYADSQ